MYLPLGFKSTLSVGLLGCWDTVYQLAHHKTLLLTGTGGTLEEEWPSPEFWGLFAPLGQPLAGGTDTALPSAPKSLSNTSLTSMSLTSSAQGTSLGTTSPGPLEVSWPVSPSGATPQQISPPHEHSHTLSNEI